MTNGVKEMHTTAARQRRQKWRQDAAATISILRRNYHVTTSFISEWCDKCITTGMWWHFTLKKITWNDMTSTFTAISQLCQVPPMSDQGCESISSQQLQQQWQQQTEQNGSSSAIMPAHESQEKEKTSIVDMTQQHASLPQVLPTSTTTAETIVKANVSSWKIRRK